MKPEIKPEERDIFQEVVDSAKSVTLSERERATLFSKVDNFVKKNPIFVEEKVSPAKTISPKKKLVSDISWYSYIFANSSKVVSFAVVVFIILGGTTSFAAQGSLPGDLLYPVKININEGVKSFFLTEQGRTNYEAVRATERINEAASLAEKGKLTPEAQAQIEANFQYHVTQIEKDIEKYKQSGQYKKALDVNENFELQLKDSKASLDVVIQKDNTDAPEIANIASKIDDTIRSSSIVKENTENAIAELPDDNTQIKLITAERLAKVKALVEEAQAKKASESVVDLNDELEEVDLDVIKDNAEDQKDLGITAVSAAPTSSVDTSAKPNKDTNTKKAVVQKIEIKNKIDLDQKIIQSKALINVTEDKIKEGRYKEAFTLIKAAEDIDIDR